MLLTMDRQTISSGRFSIPVGVSKVKLTTKVLALAIVAALGGCVLPPSQAPYSGSQTSEASRVSACRAAMALRPTQTGTFGESLGNMAQCDVDPNAALRSPPQSNPVYSSPEGGGASLGGPAFYTGERVSGFNKICFYDRDGSAVAITISETELCPQTLN
jgi:hypothetical protein